MSAATARPTGSPPRRPPRPHQGVSFRPAQRGQLSTGLDSNEVPMSRRDACSTLTWRRWAHGNAGLRGVLVRVVSQLAAVQWISWPGLTTRRSRGRIPPPLLPKGPENRALRPLRRRRWLGAEHHRGIVFALAATETVPSASVGHGSGRRAAGRRRDLLHTGRLRAGRHAPVLSAREDRTVPRMGKAADLAELLLPTSPAAAMPAEVLREVLPRLHAPPCCGPATSTSTDKTSRPR